MQSIRTGTAIALRLEDVVVVTFSFITLDWIGEVVNPPKQAVDLININDVLVLQGLFGG